MSDQVADIISLARKLSLAEQWQVVQLILKELQKETLENKLNELSLNSDVLDDLDFGQMERLSKAIEESEAGKKIPHEQVKSEFTKS